MIPEKGQGENNNMLNIMVILTGGTIGSQIDAKEHQIVCGKKDIAQQLFSEWHSEEPQAAQLKVYQPINQLSENEAPDTWHQISSFLHDKYREGKANDENREKTAKDWDGILITHGSDTLPYFAAAMGILCEDIPLPIAITAANYSLEDSRSNGYVNAGACMRYLSQKPQPGVVAIYQNPGGKTRIYDAFQLKEADHDNDRFSSYGDCYGWLEDGKAVCNGSLAERLSHVREVFRKVKEKRAERLGRGETVGKGILYLRPVPGLCYDAFNVDGQKTGAVLHDTYHSGTACTAGREGNLLFFLEKLKEKKIPLFLTGLKSEAENRYETTVQLINNGADVLADCTMETGYVLLALAYGSDE